MSLSNKEKSISQSIDKFIQEYKQQTFDAHVLIYIPKDDNNVRLFWGCRYQPGSSWAFEALKYLKDCLLISMNIIKEKEPSAFHLVKHSGHHVPQTSITETIDTIKRERYKGIDGFVACYSRLQDYKFTHGVSDHLEPGTPEYLETVCTMLHGEVIALQSIANHTSQYAPESKKLIWTGNEKEQQKFFRN